MSDCSIKYNKTETSKLTRFLSTLHKDLLKSCEYIQTININSNIDDQTKEIDKHSDTYIINDNGMFK